MICRCGHSFHAPACYIGTEHMEGFALSAVFQCPACRTTVYGTLWESAEHDRLVDDAEPLLSAARDQREDESDAA